MNMTETSQDFYEILGVDRTAGLDEIKKAYRRMALKFHPDRNPNDPEAEAKFKAAAEAYEVLSDPEKRQRYDTYGRSGLGAGAPHFSNFQDIFSAFSDIFSGADFFEDLLGFGGRRGRPRGRNLRVDIELDLREIARETEKELKLRRLERCDTCGGTGCSPGTKPTKCSYCAGRGQIEQRQGFFVMRQACPRCRGTGQHVASPCGSCEGLGQVEKDVSLVVRIPPGVEDGTRLRISGQGEAAPGTAARGDLFIDLHIRQHPFFQRSGSDLYCEVPISYATACLGGEIEVPTLDATAKVRIPAGTQSGEIVPLNGAGLPDGHGRGRGRLLIRALIETPTKLTRRQEELLHELAEIEHANVSPKRKGFLEKIRSYFADADRKSE